MFQLENTCPITDILLAKEGLETSNMYIATFRFHLHIYNLNTCTFIRDISVEDNINAMDMEWGYIFMGCGGGWLYRYSIEVRFFIRFFFVFFNCVLSLKRKSIEYEENFNEGTILSLKAAVEGPRRILLIATEDAPVCIRDAMTGLCLRVLARHITNSVNTLFCDKNLVYCGTNRGKVFVLSFHVSPETPFVKCVPI